MFNKHRFVHWHFLGYTFTGSLHHRDNLPSVRRRADHQAASGPHVDLDYCFQSHTHTHFSGCYAITTHMTSKNGSRLIFSQTIHIPHPDEVDLKTRQLWIRRISKTKSQIKIKPDETSTAFSYRRILQTTRLDLRTNTASRTTGIKNTPTTNEK